MNLSNLDIDKIVNNIPNKFKYVEKGKITDWTKLLNKKVSIPKKKYKVEALQDYTDKRPELIIYDNDYFELNDLGNANVRKGNIYYLDNDDRAKEIKDSGLAKVTKIGGSTRKNNTSN